MNKITAYILAKNEQENIGKCLKRLVDLSIPTVVLDSGSTDNTKAIVAQFPSVVCEDYKYTNHADAYNWITEIRTPHGEWALVLDSDMEVTSTLWKELSDVSTKPDIDAIRSPILMYSEGLPLKYGSLCPPKTILLRGGKKLFEGMGHGERLVESIRVEETSETLIHDDQKPYSQYLLTQLRYANNLLNRAQGGAINWKDRVRLKSPLLALIVPLYSFIVKWGCFAGAAGRLYAIDRLIAELLQYRQALAQSKTRSKTGDSTVSDQKIPTN